MSQILVTYNNFLLGTTTSVRKAGRILTIGTGDVGQLGLGEEIIERKRAVPIKAVDGVSFIQVTCGGMHSVAVTVDGEVIMSFWSCYSLNSTILVQFLK